jgi:hypothetical protein
VFVLQKDWSCSDLCKNAIKFQIFSGTPFSVSIERSVLDAEVIHTFHSRAYIHSIEHTYMLSTCTGFLHKDPKPQLHTIFFRRMMTKLLSWMVLFSWMLYTLHVFRFHGAESEKKFTDVPGVSHHFFTT